MKKLKVRQTITIDPDIIYNIIATGVPISKLIQDCLENNGYGSSEYIDKLILDKEKELEQLKLKKAIFIKNKLNIELKEKAEIKLTKEFNLEKIKYPTIDKKSWMERKLKELKIKYGDNYGEEI